MAWNFEPGATPDDSYDLHSEREAEERDALHEFMTRVTQAEVWRPVPAVLSADDADSLACEGYAVAFPRVCVHVGTWDAGVMDAADHRWSTATLSWFAPVDLSDDEVEAARQEAA